jgi:molybdenum cofactor cytidylyltransferase
VTAGPVSAAGLILAAGKGARFGTTSKLVADLEGRPLLEHAVRAQCAVGELERVVVVLGAHAREILSQVDFGRAEAVVCEDWRYGQSASLRCGAAHLSGCERVLVTLGDQPLLTPAVLRRMLAAPAGARAVYDGRPGHPVVLGAPQLSALEALRGDEGARRLLDGPRIECGDLAVGADVDTPRDLEEIRHEAGAVLPR